MIRGFELLEMIRPKFPPERTAPVFGSIAPPEEVTALTLLMGLARFRSFSHPRRVAHAAVSRRALWRAVWLSVGNMDRPSNGQDLPLPVDLAHLPVFDAGMVNLVVDDKIVIECHQP